MLPSGGTDGLAEAALCSHSISITVLSCFAIEPSSMHILYMFCFFLNKFIYFWLRWFFVAAWGLSLVAASEGYSLLLCAGFSLRWLLFLWSTGSRCAGFSSCGMRAQ